MRFSNRRDVHTTNKQMSKQKEDTAVMPVENVPASIELNGKIMSVAQMAENLKKMEVGEELTSEYFSLEPGEIERVFFVGNTTMTSKNPDGGETSAVKLLTSDGKMGVNGDRVIVGALKDLPIPTAVEIECTGYTKSAKGKYRTFNIRKLN